MKWGLPSQKNEYPINVSNGFSVNIKKRGDLIIRKASELNLPVILKLSTFVYVLPFS